jgi:hypothetical protein
LGEQKPPFLLVYIDTKDQGKLLTKSLSTADFEQNSFIADGNREFEMKLLRKGTEIVSKTDSQP